MDRVKPNTKADVHASAKIESAHEVIADLKTPAEGGTIKQQSGAHEKETDESLKEKLTRCEALLELKKGAEKGMILPFRLVGHTSIVYTTILTGDGKTLISAGQDKSIRLWDLTTNLSKTLGGHVNSIFTLALSRDEKTLASAGLDKDIRIWSLETGECLKRLRGSRARINSLVFCADGDRVIAGGADETINIWSIKEEKIVAQFPSSSINVTTLALSQDEDTLISGQEDGKIRIWSVKRGICLHELPGHEGMVSSLALRADGKLLVSGGADKALRMWSVETGAALNVLNRHQSHINGLALSPNGEILVSGSFDKTLCVWALNSGQCLKETKFEKPVSAMTALTKDYYFALADKEGTIHYLHAYSFLDDSLIALARKETEIQKAIEHVSEQFSLEQKKREEEYNGKLADLKKREDALQSKLLEQKKEAEQLQAKVAGLENSISEHQKQNEQYKKNVSEIQQKEKELKLHIETLNKKVLNLTAQLAPLQQGAAQFSDIEKRLVAENEKLRYQLASLLKEQEETQSELKAKQTEIAKKQDSLGEREKDIKKFTERVAELERMVNPIIDNNEIGIINDSKTIAEGRSSNIYLGLYRNAKVAVKELKLTGSLESRDELNTEIQMLSKLHFPNVVKFYGCCLSPKYRIVLEWMPKGNLRTFLDKNAPDWDIRGRMVFELASAMAYLHSENIVHQNIKSSNVLLDEELHVKLTGFGLAKIRNEALRKSSSAGALVAAMDRDKRWMAPEMFRKGGSYRKETDIYSFGVTLWEIASRQIPFEDEPDLSSIPSLIEKGSRDPIPKECPERYATLITHCWDKEAKKRPTAAQVLEYLNSKATNFAGWLSKSDGVSVTETAVSAAKK